jgi:hypothetical protein
MVNVSSSAGPSLYSGVLFWWMQEFYFCFLLFFQRFPFLNFLAVGCIA